VSGAVATPEPRQPQVPPTHSAAPGSRTNKATDGQSDYQRDLDRIKAAIAETGPEALATPVDTPRAIRYAYSLYQRALLTGDLTQLPAAEQAIDITINHLPNPGDLYLLKAKLAFKLHRLADVKRSLAAIPSLAEAAEAKGLEADLYIQRANTKRQRRLTSESLTRNQPGTTSRASPISWRAWARSPMQTIFLLGRRTN
jgi:hypothetical protein